MILFPELESKARRGRKGYDAGVKGKAAGASVDNEAADKKGMKCGTFKKQSRE